MKNCPYCAEPIQDAAIVCRHGRTDLRSGASVDAQPSARPAPSIADDPAMRMLLPVGRSPLAIAAGYLGLFSFLVCPAPISLVVSALAIRQLRNDPSQHGMGRAVFGLIMGILGTLVLLVTLIAAAMGR